MAIFIHTSATGEGEDTTIFCTIETESGGSSSSSTTYRFTLPDARQLTSQLEKHVFDALIQDDPHEQAVGMDEHNDPHERAALMDEHFERQLDTHELFFADEPF